MKTEIVEIIPAGDKPSGTKAKILGTNEKPEPIWFGTDYPKAMNKMVKLNRLSFTRWKAIKTNTGWMATEFIKN